MKPLPIRARFALWSALAMACALGALAAGTLYNLHQRHLREADEEIASEAEELGVLLPEHAPETIVWDQDPFLGWTVFDATGRMRRVDPNITEAVARSAIGRSGIVRIGSFWRGWRVAAFPAAGGSTLVIGYDLVKVRAVLRDLVIAYAWSLPLVVIVVAGGSWWVTGRALAPFRKLAGAIEGIRSENLTHRVPVPPAQDEIQRLATSFNALLARLESSFAQTKRFAADASHELRTPLTIMRSEVEQILGRPDLPPGPLAALVSLQDEIARLDRITEQLLQLARFDAGQIVLKETEIDCSSLLKDACEDAELLASAADVTLGFDVEPDVRIRGDPHHLRRLFLNLLDNACKHNHRGGQARCELKREAQDAVLRIANTGPGIPAEMRTRVFERFFRADASRANMRGHGFGLALSWEIVALHGGSLALLEASAPGWTEFEVRFPLAAFRAK